MDLSSLVGKGVFQRWEDPLEFAAVYVDPESGTVAWPGGLDLAPDGLYRDIAGITAGQDGPRRCAWAAACALGLEAGEDGRWSVTGLEVGEHEIIVTGVVTGGQPRM